jgi:hypothetical protein
LEPVHHCGHDTFVQPEHASRFHLNDSDILHLESWLYSHRQSISYYTDIFFLILRIVLTECFEW